MFLHAERFLLRSSLDVFFAGNMLYIIRKTTLDETASMFTIGNVGLSDEAAVIQQKKLRFRRRLFSALIA